MRRLLFQVHLWIGVLTGTYLSIVCVTGSALVFRIDIQRALYPGLFTPSASGPLVGPLTVMDRVSRAYPNDALSGVEAPTTARDTYLAYVTKGSSYLTVLVDPVSADVLGELPDRTLVRAIQDLHFSLMLGRTGRLFNGIGAACALVMCVTGLALWWPGAGSVLRALTVNVRRTSRRVTWELHRAAGAWSVTFLLIWAVTGLSFSFPSAFRSAVGWLSPVTVVRPPASNGTGGSDTAGRPTWAAQLARAQQLVPGRPVARVVLPANGREAFLVMFARASPTPTGPALESVYLDQFTGEPLPYHRGPQTMGDRFVSAMTPLHIGDVVNRNVKYVWFIMGLTPPVLFGTGLALWWTRVVRPRLRP